MNNPIIIWGLLATLLIICSIATASCTDEWNRLFLAGDTLSATSDVQQAGMSGTTVRSGEKMRMRTAGQETSPQEYIYKVYGRQQVALRTDTVRTYPTIAQSACLPEGKNAYRLSGSVACPPIRPYTVAKVVSDHKDLLVAAPGEAGGALNLQMLPPSNPLQTDMTSTCRTGMGQDGLSAAAA